MEAELDDLGKSLLESVLLASSGEDDNVLEKWEHLLRKLVLLQQKIRKKKNKSRADTLTLLLEVTNLLNSLSEVLTEQKDICSKLAKSPPELLKELPEYLLPHLSEYIDSYTSKNNSSSIFTASQDIICKITNHIFNVLKLLGHIYNDVKPTMDDSTKSLFAANHREALESLLYVSNATVSTLIVFHFSHGYKTPRIMSSFTEVVHCEVKKQATAKARTTKEVESKALHERILNTYYEIKANRPEISKNAASLLIGPIAKINLTPQVIRRHLNKI
ncbi:hypothetical protein [Geomonas paludis]|uniref:Uncharacterized protein n=1 Tax=Geomonas paludis TaxID=2740185 RepID=A0A6V8N1Q3_9BACT|nr:hypothetical protein [Geomonas paludis]GFO66331.1 hypothetical protein GMPD_42500 [Geomonas paludis]